MKTLLEISFKPYAMTDDKSQGLQEQGNIFKDDLRSQFQQDCDMTILFRPDNLVLYGPRSAAAINKLVYALEGLTPDEIELLRG